MVYIEDLSAGQPERGGLTLLAARLMVAQWQVA